MSITKLVLQVSQRALQSLILIVAVHAPTLNASTEITKPEFATWQAAVDDGIYDEAVELSLLAEQDPALRALISQASQLNLSEKAQWRALLHYKPASSVTWLSQVDSAHFFMSDKGKASPEAELNATLAALFSTEPKPPLRLTAHCRFIARKVWLSEQLPEFDLLVPQQDCPEFERYVNYLDASVLTLVFPTAHPNSPSSAFGHTLLRIDKKNQKPESRLLNMSLNFAADVPANVPAFTYAVKGLSGGFEGRFRMLPYHIKLREYGQIENRDTWEYELDLDQDSVDLVLRHAYEMLISHFDYFFFSENCSYHLLSLLEVAYPDNPLTDEFNWWTIPVDTIRALEQKDLANEPRFVPSAIRTLRARQANMSEDDLQIALKALNDDLSSIDSQLNSRSVGEQVAILDLLSDYERYNRLKTDPSALGSGTREKAILSRRSKLGIKSVVPDIARPESTPVDGHGTSRIGLRYRFSDNSADIVELSFRPAYHDFRDPSAGFDDKAAIELGGVSVAHDRGNNEFFLKRVTLASIQSVEPIGRFYKPVSWHTTVEWDKPNATASHQFTFNAGAGIALQHQPKLPVLFAFGEFDLINNNDLLDNTQVRIGVSAGTHWEPLSGFRTGFTANVRHQIGGDFYIATTDVWSGFAISEHWSANVEFSSTKTPDADTDTQISVGIRAYF
ncbi:MAG: DUF4105 domain-containing protein [Granulosicoccus sp.]